MALSSDIISRLEQIEELFQQLGSKLNKAGSILVIGGARRKRNVRVAIKLRRYLRTKRSDEKYGDP